jgi:hypothetical protein
MPLLVNREFPSLLIRREPFERAGLTRESIDQRLLLTGDEFRVEGDLICVGPVIATDEFQDMIAELEEAGLNHFDDFFDLSGGWPEWLSVFAMARRRT